MKYVGLSESEVLASREKHGRNEITQKEKETLLQKFIEAFKDKMVIILCACLAINFVMFLMGLVHWYEPVALFCVVCIVTFVNVFSEYKNESKFEQLEAEASKLFYKVYRGGKLIEIPQEDIVVGDHILIQYGEQIPVDGILLDGHLKVDQASLNGESLEATKLPLGDNELGDTRDFLNKYYVFKSTFVTSGEAVIKATQVGDKTIFGEMAKEMQEETRISPLKLKLNKLADLISKGGYIMAIAIGVTFLIQNVYEIGLSNLLSDIPNLIKVVVNTLMLSVTIVVMAVPEGLPMMIALVLAMNMKKMISDNVLVRKRDAMDTAGSVSVVISDKTGTFTTGQLEVTEIADGDMNIYKGIKDLPDDLQDNFIMGIGVNNSSNVSDGTVIGNNSTDRAMLLHILNAGLIDKVDKSSVIDSLPFSSDIKYASVTSVIDSASFKFVKGAPEIVLNKCTKYISANGEVKDINLDALNNYMDNQAEKCMRLIAVAVTSQVEGEELPSNMVLIGLVSLRDNLRPEVKASVEQIKKANVQVIMATGDRKETAVAIAKEAGLIDSDECVALTSQELAKMSDDEVKAILPKLRVLARALPTDKSRLCRLAQELGEVVGMVGDGANDSPSIKLSDVGFCMNAGSEVAKSASDVILLDNNFASIVTAILYGRTIFKSIRKFIVFQLTVNVAAVLVSFFGPLTGVHEPLTVIQILAINMVMDTLAALAFGTEPALKRYMNEKPVDREANIVSGQMVASVLTAGLFIFAMSMAILHLDVVQSYFRVETDMEIKTAMFSFFMFAIMFNGFNARTDSYNLFEHITENKNFILVMLGVFVMQIAMIYLGGVIFNTVPLQLETLIKVLSFAFLVILIDMLRKIIVHQIKK